MSILPLFYDVETGWLEAVLKGVARGGQMGQQPHPGMSLPHLGGAEGAAAPPWHGCKDPKLTKKRGKHKKKNDKKLLKIKNIDKK